jgi:hypothetical protein
MNDKNNPYQLIVEGDEDKRFVPELIEKHGIKWSDGLNGHRFLANIKAADGIANIAAKDYLSVQFKMTGLQALGIIIDADGLDDQRSSSVSALLDRCRVLLPQGAWHLTKDGIINTHADGRRLGLWVMPDNVNPGMLEDLILSLPVAAKNAQVEWAQEAVRKAKDEREAPFKEVHRSKAEIHTLLAWQDPPGRQLHQAIKENILQPHSEVADRFVKWFKRLFPIN